jgi:hypothetical protein
MTHTEYPKIFDPFLENSGGKLMILGRMTDMVVWETVISGSGHSVPQQHCFLSGNIFAGACYGCSGPQPMILQSFISFCEFLPRLGFFWHLAKHADVLTRYI